MKVNQATASGPNPHYEGCFEGESEELAALRRRLAAENDRLKAVMRFEWDEAGEPLTFAAAAQDADTWLALIELRHDEGRGPWKFSAGNSLEKLRDCRNNLRRCLPPNDKA